jgi:ATP-dependent Lon protease
MWSAEDASRAVGVGQPAVAQAGGAAKQLPDDALILIPLRNAVLFPGVLSPVTVGRAASIAAAQEAVKNELRAGFLLQRDPQKADVGPSDLYWVGTAGPIVRYITGQEGAHHLVVQGESRFRVLEFLEGWPFLVARVATIEQPQMEGPEVEARFLQLKEQAIEAIGLLPHVPDELAGAVRGIESPAVLADMVANLLDAKNEEKQDILETFDWCGA